MKTRKQNIANILTDEGRADIVRRFATEEHPPVLTFLKDGKERHFKVVAIKKGVWVREVTLHRPEDMEVVEKV